VSNIRPLFNHVKLLTRKREHFDGFDRGCAQLISFRVLLLFQSKPLNVCCQRIGGQEVEDQNGKVRFIPTSNQSASMRLLTNYRVYKEDTVSGVLQIR
jgi:hypothetical protein